MGARLTSQEIYSDKAFLHLHIFPTTHPCPQHHSSLLVRMLVQLDDRRITNNFVGRRSQLIALVLLRLKQEVQLLQRLSVRFGKEEVDKHNLET